MTTPNAVTKTSTTTAPVSKWSKKEKDIIRKQFFPAEATTDDMLYCMGVADQLGLNPITKQIWFVPRKSMVNGQWREKIEPMCGRDSFLTLAHRSGKFAGIKSKVEIVGTPILVSGNWEMQNDLVGIAEVRRTDTSEVFRVEVSYKEYVQTTKSGDPTKFWRDKPQTMLKKVAESQALRKAFNISGLYAEEEIRIEHPKDVEVDVTAPKSEIDNQQEAYVRAEAALLDCNTIDQLRKAMDNFTKEDLGPYWNKLDQIFLGCEEDLSQPPAVAEKVETTVLDDADFPQEEGQK